MVQRYLLRRGKIYYFRWRVPADLRPVLGLTELKQSLRTGDSLRAAGRARPFVAAVVNILTARQAYIALELTLDEYKAAVLGFSTDVCAMARKKFKNNGLDLITLSKGLTTLVINYDNDHVKEVEAAKLLMDDGFLAAEEVLSAPVSMGMPFSELYAGFLAHKMDKKEARKEHRRPLNDRMRAEYDRYFNVMIEIMGDVPISTITRKKLKDVVLTFSSLPRRNLKNYKDVPVLDLLEMEIPDGDLISSSTISQVKKLVQGVFSYAVEKDLLESSPAREMKLRLENKTRFAAFSDAEVKALLAKASNESTQWKKWIVNLAAYTGARRGELVQLRKQDIKFDTDCGRYYILITEKAGNVKTENANRQIPLHGALIEHGFLTFVDSADDRLFGDLSPQAVTKWFARFRDSLDIELLDDYDHRKVFHSFRHTFITKSLGAENQIGHVQQVVGHEKISFGETDTYGHQQPLKLVLGVVDKVVYD